MSYKNIKWIVSYQDDGCNKSMNGWYYICDSDGGILLGYFREKKVAELLVGLLNNNVFGT